MGIIITVDGLNGVGKTTVANTLAKKISFITFSSGIVFRCLAIQAKERNLTGDNFPELIKLLDNMILDIHDNRIILNGKDVTTEARSNEIAIFCSENLKNEHLRSKIREVQRKFAEGKNIIVDGRDAGSAVFPEANVKFILQASFEERVSRKIECSSSTDSKKVEEDLARLDEYEKKKVIIPADAIIIDSTGKTIEEVADEMLKIIEKKCILKLIQNNEIKTIEHIAKGNDSAETKNRNADDKIITYKNNSNQEQAD